MKTDRGRAATLLRALFCAFLLVVVCGEASAQIVASILPSSRSVVVGHTATAFATIINAGSTAATGCAIALPSGISASLSYQTTNPATNALTGAANTPVTIQPSGVQTFLIAITPTAPFASTDIALSFTCSGLDPAPTLSGINTLLLTASSTSGPDIVALAATITNNGQLSLPSTTGAGAFAVATVNVGAADTITATADTGSSITLPVTITVCQTVPATGACMGTPAASVAVSIPANGTPTFGIFVTGTGNVANLPGADRVVVHFTSSSGTQVGSTSVAVDTSGYQAPAVAGLAFTPPVPAAATTGTGYNFCYCSPTPSGSNGLCGSPTQSNPSGGHPPYHFQLGSGGGFPPIGIILGLNGCLNGTPSVAGTRSFNVCAIDLNGAQQCLPSSVTVQQGGQGTIKTEIGGDVTTQTVITLDGATIKTGDSQNLDYLSNLAAGQHQLVISCPGAQSFCVADLSISVASGYTASPSSFNLDNTQLPANGSVTESFTISASP